MEQVPHSFDFQFADLRRFVLKQLLIAIRVFALLTLLFVPAFAVLIIIALINGETSWFTAIGIPALFLNAAIVLAKPQRDRVWRWVNAIAGTNARL